MSFNMTDALQFGIQPPIRAVHMGVFPTLGSLQEVVDIATSKLPITNANELTSLLFTYHNTLLKLVQDK